MKCPHCEYTDGLEWIENDAHPESEEVDGGWGGFYRLPRLGREGE